MKKLRVIKTLTALIALFIMGIVFVGQAQSLSRQIFITVKINGKCVTMDTLPYIKNSRTMVPIRFVAEALNADVEWDGQERKVYINYNKKNIELFIGSNKITVDGIEHLMDTKAEIVNRRTMVPVRFVAENMGCSVEWDAMTYTVLIYRDNAVIPASYINNRNYSDEDIIWLARIVTVEARGLSIDAKVAVANVVLNRKRSTDFPNSIYNVIFDRKYSVQFPPAHKSGFKESIPASESIIASKMALEGINNISACLYFNNAPFKGKADDLYKIIEGEYFYY